MSAVPLVSFVVPCFNYGQFLPDCLAGIFGQQGGFTDIEVIAIDDSSTDNTVQVLVDWSAREPRLKVIRHATNQGHVLTVNEGLAIARGRFVARVDPDDRYRPNFLSTLLPLFDRSPRVGKVYGDAAMIDAAGQLTCARCPQPHDGKSFYGPALLDILEKNYICAPTAIARREAWQKHLPIWEGLAFNDWYFNVMIARDYDYAYVPEVVADYRVHSTNHHTRIVVSKAEEPSLLRVLDWVYCHAELDPCLEQQKQNVKGRVYAAHYLDLAEKYFGVGYEVEARRCYLEVLRRQPAWLLRPGPFRRLLGTLIGRRSYEAIKRLLQRVVPAPPTPVDPT